MYLPKMEPQPQVQQPERGSSQIHSEVQADVDENIDSPEKNADVEATDKLLQQWN